MSILPHVLTYATPLMPVFTPGGAKSQDHTSQRWVILWVALFFCSCVILHAGDHDQDPFEPDLTFESMGLERGLPQSSTNCLMQDQTGYIWVGTFGGLSRFDGINFTAYRRQTRKKNTLPSNHIFNLFQQRDGTFWVSTGRGLCQFDPNAGTFKPFPENGASVPWLIFGRKVFFMEDLSQRVWMWTRSGEGTLLRKDPDGKLHTFFSKKLGKSLIVSSVDQDSKGRIWIASENGGLLRYQELENSFKYYQHPVEQPTNIARDKLVFEDEAPGFGGRQFLGGKLKFDELGRIWFPTPLGMNVFDPSTEKTEHFPFPIKAGEPLIHSLNGWFHDPQGHYWIQSSQNLFRFDPKARSYQIYPTSRDSLDGNPFHITDSLISRNGVLWLSTLQQGVCRFDPKNNRFVYSRNDPHDPRSINSNSLTQMLEDHSGSIWFCSNEAGVSKYSPVKRKFQHFFHPRRLPQPLRGNVVWSLLVDRSGQTWAGMNADGLVRLSADRSRITQQYLKGSSIRGIFEDRDGLIWFTTILQQTITTYTVAPKTGLLTNQGNRSIEDATELPTGEGFLYVERPVGLQQYTYASKKFGPVIYQGPTPTWHEASRLLILDKDNYLVSNHHNLVVCHPNSQSFDVIAHDPKNSNSLSAYPIFDIAQTPDSVIWVALNGGGFDRWDREAGTFKNFNSMDGLGNDDVYHILSDEKGKLWLSTNGGISRFDPYTESFRNFGTEDGLQSLEFNAGSAAISDEGEILLGGINGFNSFYPDSLPSNPSPPPLVLSVFLKGNHELGNNLPSGSSISLEPNEPVVFFSYSGLDYVNPSKNAYAYRLEGFAEDWQYVGNSRLATYTSLPHGTYKFQLKAANSDGVWTQKPHELNLTVKPRYFETLLFQISVLVGGLSLLILFAFQQQKKTRLGQEEALRQRDHLRKSEELEYARAIQLAMLPGRDLICGDVEMKGEMATASEVGGDYFDFFELGNQQIGMAFGDATGHGVGAGLIVGMAKLAATAWSLNPKPPREMVKELNSTLRLSLPMKAMGMGFGLVRYDLSSHQAEICCSGMPYPLHYILATKKLVPLVLKGPPLGYLKSFEPQTIQVKVAEGDRLLFLTDGFGERFNDRDKIWGDRAVLECLQKACQKWTATHRILTQLFIDCNQFSEGRPCDDDMTVVCIHRRAPATEGRPEL